MTRAVDAEDHSEVDARGWDAVEGKTQCRGSSIAEELMGLQQRKGYSVVAMQCCSSVVPLGGQRRAAT